MTSDILALMMLGLTDQQIARRLRISDRTIRRHLSAVMDERSCRTRFQLGYVLGKESRD